MSHYFLGHRSISMLPTAKVYPPVSAGELHSVLYQVPLETVTEKITSHLEANSEIPGVVLLQNGKFHSSIPRSKMFERLGHRYGVELFLRKPIVELQVNLQNPTTIIPHNIRINEAVNIALARKADNIFDALVVEYSDNNYHMLDMHILLGAQSLILENSNNVISSLNRIEKSIKAEIPLDAALDMIIDAIKRVAPYHRALILIRPDRWKSIYSQHPILYRLSDNLNYHPFIKSISQTQQHVHLEDTQTIAEWKGMDTVGKARTWLGFPILTARGLDGILSLSRISASPFSSNEIDMVKIFSEIIGIAINRDSDDSLFKDMIKRKFL